jgi:hypothetical protein
MRAQWRDEQERCERDIEHHRAADDSYMDQGIQILSLGRNAHRLFVAQPAKEKRSLLNFLLSNSTWAQGALSVKFKEPFDLLAETVAAATRVEETRGAASARNEIWLMAQSGANPAPVKFPVLQGNYRDLPIFGAKSHPENANTGGDSAPWGLFTLPSNREFFCS